MSESVVTVACAARGTLVLVLVVGVVESGREPGLSRRTKKSWNVG